jgi:2-hydroxychromene-2-carboxylate isomerase
MAKTVEFLYDFVSSPSFIAWKSLPPMLEAAGAELVLTPVLLGGIFKATGNAGPLAIAAKKEWYAGDLALWAKKRRVVLNPSPFIPFRSLPLMRGSYVAAERGETDLYVSTVFDAAFVQGRDMGDMRVVADTLAAAGLDSAAYVQGIERADIKLRLLDATQQAVARRVFGVPTFFVDGNLFFGQDRLEFVLEALQRS